MILRVVAMALYSFLYLPLGVIVAESFNASPFAAGWSGWTFSWYRAALTDSSILSAGRATLIIAVSSTMVSTLLGTLLGYGLSRHQFIGKTLFERLILLSVAVPDIVMAVSLLLFYALVRKVTGLFNLGFATMITAHITFQTPFVALIIRARMRGLDPALEEAAYDLGASRLQRFWHVTLPLIRPGIMAAALLALTLSLDDFVVSFFTSGPGSSTVPIYIYGAVKRGVTAEIHALATVLIAVAILLTVALNRFESRQKEK